MTKSTYLFVDFTNTSRFSLRTQLQGFVHLAADSSKPLCTQLQSLSPLPKPLTRTYRCLQIVLLKNPLHYRSKIIPKDLPFPHRAALYLYLLMVCRPTYFLLLYIISWADNPLTWAFTFHTSHILEVYNIFILISRLSYPKLLCETFTTKQKLTHER